MKFGIQLLCGLLVLAVSPLAKADVNVLAEGELVLAVSAMDVAYKRADADHLNRLETEAATQICQDKGYGEYVRHVLAEASTPGILATHKVVSDGVLVDRPVEFQSPWVWVKRPQLTRAEEFRFIKDGMFLQSCFSAGLSFYTCTRFPGFLASAWNSYSRWDGYVLEISAAAAIISAPFIFPSIRGCIDGVCRKWLNFEITAADAQQRLQDGKPAYRYNVGEEVIAPRLLKEVWCKTDDVTGEAVD